MKDEILKRKLVFYQSFPSLIEMENSNLGKLLLQENLISNEIISTLRVIELYMDNFLNSEYLKNGIEIKIPKSDDLVQNYTLGRLIKLLKEYCNEKYVETDKLDKYVKKRNKITHRFFCEYENIESICMDAKESIILGKKILATVRKFKNAILNTIIEKTKKK